MSSVPGPGPFCTSPIMFSQSPRRFARNRDHIIFMSFKLNAISHRKLIEEQMRVNPRLERILAYQSVFLRISTTASELEDDDPACCAAMSAVKMEKGGRVRRDDPPWGDREILSSLFEVPTFRERKGTAAVSW